jgi:hypothetical protein
MCSHLYSWSEQATNNESDIKCVKIQGKRNKTEHCIFIFSTDNSLFINSSRHNQHREE